MRETCAICKYFMESFMTKDTGFCRRYPETVKKDHVAWCGEFKSKENKYED